MKEEALAEGVCMSSVSRRVLSIDVLRGLMASAVMLYHFFSWGGGGLDASSILSRFGIFGVSVFYLVSGYSMASVYWGGGIRTSFEFKAYCVKRYFRIAPLFYVASFAFLGYAAMKGGIELEKVFLNFTFLFALIDPSSYYATGAWSIGNEIVFYLLFAIMLSFRCRFWLLIAALLLFFLFQLYFRFFILSPSESLSSQWFLYINPLNHAFYFFVGVLTFLLGSRLEGRMVFIFCLGMAMFIFLAPFSGDRVGLVYGFSGLAMSLSSIAIFILFLGFNRLELFRAKVLVLLGDWSYSIYLLHPICWFLIDFLCGLFSVVFSGYVVFVASLFTLIVSAFSYNFLEKPCSKFGRKWVQKYA